MEVLAEDRSRTRGSLVMATVLLGLPSVVAFLASRTFFSDASHFTASGLWFIYRGSVFLTYITIVVSAGLIVTVAALRKASPGTVLWMTVPTIITAVFLWLATYSATISQ